MCEKRSKSNNTCTVKVRVSHLADGVGRAEEGAQSTTFLPGITGRIKPLNRSRLRRFFSRVELRGGCWEWTGTKNLKGYGSFFATSAHRTPYVWFVGAIPAGYHVDHLCRNTSCVNPAHLEAVTLQENHRRAALARTHCQNGLHPRIGQWTHGRGVYRTCAKCHVLREKRYLARVAAARADALSVAQGA